jgi:hypothetical protein
LSLTSGTREGRAKEKKTQETMREDKLKDGVVVLKEATKLFKYIKNAFYYSN